MIKRRSPVTRVHNHLLSTPERQRDAYRRHWARVHQYMKNFELPPVFRPESASVQSFSSPSAASLSQRSLLQKSGAEKTGWTSFSQVSTGKSSVDWDSSRHPKKEQQRPDQIALFVSQHFSSVQEAEESEESPSAVPISPLLMPVMHKFVPYVPPRKKSQKIRKRNTVIAPRACQTTIKSAMNIRESSIGDEVLNSLEGDSITIALPEYESNTAEKKQL